MWFFSHTLTSMSLHFISVFIFSYSFLLFEGLIAYSLLIYKFYLDNGRHASQ